MYPALSMTAGAETALGRAQERSVGDAVAGARAVVCPIPGLGGDGSIFAPHWPDKPHLGPRELARCAKPGVVIMGTASPTFRADVAAAGLTLREYEQDDELMILRSRAIAEGAIRVAIEHTDVTLHRAKTFLLGLGRSSFTLCEVLLALGADLTVVARNPAQLARAWEMGAEALHLKDLPEAIGAARIIFNTIPARVVDGPMLARTAKDAVIIDMSAPPGGLSMKRPGGSVATWSGPVGWDRVPRSRSAGASGRGSAGSSWRNWAGPRRPRAVTPLARLSGGVGPGPPESALGPPPG